METLVEQQTHTDQPRTGLDYLGLGNNPPPPAIQVDKPDAPIDGESEITPLLNESIEVIENEVPNHDPINEDDHEPAPLDPEGVVRRITTNCRRTKSTNRVCNSSSLG